MVRSYDKEALLGALNEIMSADGDKEVLLREYCRNLHPDSSISDQEAESFTGVSLQRERK